MPNIQLRKTYYDKIYNYRPSWLIRWGLLLTLVFIIIIISMSGFIKYPDIVPAIAEITTINPPQHIISRINGRIKKIWFDEGAIVKEGEPLVMLETPVKWEDVQLLKQYVAIIDSCRDHKENVIKMEIFKTELHLGELQSYYNVVLESYNEFEKYLTFNYGKKEIETKKMLLRSKSEYLKKQIERKKLYEKLYNLAEVDYARDSLLFQSKTIAPLEFETSTQKLLELKASLVDMDLNIMANKTEVSQLASEIELLTINEEKQRGEIELKLQQCIAQLVAQIDLWEQNYLLISSIPGKITYNSYWSENQNVKAGDIVVSVVPLDSMQIKVRVRFPIQNSGKIHIHQKVNIKVENYPSTEFGFLRGKLTSISTVPSDTFYTAEVRLDKGLITSYNKRLLMEKYLVGSAEILTDDYSLLVRIINPLKAFLKEKVYRERNKDINN